jgi:hypothetical protein
MKESRSATEKAHPPHHCPHRRTLHACTRRTPVPPLHAAVACLPRSLSGKGGRHLQRISRLEACRPPPPLPIYLLLLLPPQHPATRTTTFFPPCLHPSRLIPTPKTSCAGFAPSSPSPFPPSLPPSLPPALPPPSLPFRPGQARHEFHVGIDTPVRANLSKGKLTFFAHCAPPLATHASLGIL